MKAEPVSRQEVLKYFQRYFNMGLRKARLYPEILSSIEHRALKYHLIRKLCDVGAEFYTTHQGLEGYWFPIKTRYLRFLSIMGYHPYYCYPCRLDNSIYFPVVYNHFNQIIYRGTLLVYAGEVDEVPFHTPFDNSERAPFDRARGSQQSFSTDDPELRTWVKNISAYIKRYKRFLNNRSVTIPPPLPSGRTVVFYTLPFHQKIPSNRGKDWWDCVNFTPYESSYIPYNQQELMELEAEEQKRQARIQSEPDEWLKALQAIKQTHAPFYSSSHYNFDVYKIQLEDLPASFRELKVPTAVEKVANEYYLFVVNDHYPSPLMSRHVRLYIPITILKASRLLEGVVKNRIYQLTREELKDYLPAFYIGIAEHSVVDQNRHLHLMLCITPRKDLTVPKNKLAKIIRTRKRIIVLPPGEGAS